MNARSCFGITAIKNDYNKKLRKFCMGTHGECIKERQDITVDKEGDGPQRHFDWKDKYLCKISPEKNNTSKNSESAEYWKQEAEKLKEEVSELKQQINDISEKDDLNFEDLFVSL